MTEILIVIAVVIILSATWGRVIDNAIKNNEWERQRAKDKEEEDREQEEYLREYTKRKREKKDRRKRR